MSPIGSKIELQDIIRNAQLTSVFQPIVDIQQHYLFGYEALIRGPANSTLHSPLALFDTASRFGMMGDLEYACREVSCNSFVQAETEGKLFLNISPMSITEKGYRQGITHSIINRLGLPAERIVIELSEQYPLDDYQLLREATDHFRTEGFQIAIDDLGAGYAGLRAWSELRPDYVKIDRHFIEHIHRDTVKREFVRSIRDIAQELECKVIAEGIETGEDLTAIQELGLQYGQGYFIGRPEIAPEPEAKVLDRIVLFERHDTKSYHRSTERVENITRNSPSVSPSTSLLEVGELFQKDKNMGCLPIVDKGCPLGIVDRHAILELFSQRYSRELHGRKPISQFMDNEMIMVPHTTPLQEVSRTLTENNPDRLIQDFIVTRDNQYDGTGKTSVLLKKITEQQIRNARYANPLTMLPGNVPIHDRIDELLRANKPFYLAYFDLNFFKPYNDHYGYSRGDDVIVTVARILQENVDPTINLVGHVGGDDFVVIFESEDYEAVCRTILDKFAAKAGEFYCKNALDEGGIWGVSRTGEKQFFELLSLAVGIAHPDPTYCASHHHVAELAVDAKKQAKLIGGNSIFLNQRRKPNSISAETTAA